MRRYRTLGRFFRTPKGMLTIVLTALTAAAAPGVGLRLVAPNLVAAVAAGALVDMVVLRIRKERWEFPSGAVLTGLIIAMVLRPQGRGMSRPARASGRRQQVHLSHTDREHLQPGRARAGRDVLCVRLRAELVGALPELPPAVVALIASGMLIADRVNKLPMVLAFLGSYYLLFTITAFVSDPGHVAEIFRAPTCTRCCILRFHPDGPANFADEMRDQILCSVIVAVVSYAVFEWIGAAYYLLAGVLVGNVWEAWRRRQTRRERAVSE